MSDDHFISSNVLIAGLGVIGGSVAKSLWKAGCSNVYAYDRDTESLNTAKADGVLRDGFTSLDEAPMVDIVICCLPPDLVVSCYKDTAPHIKSGGVFAELGGLKTQIIAELESALMDHHELLSLHPMAGSEKSGYAHSYTHMFVDCMMILAASKKTGETARRWGDALCRAMVCREMCEMSAAQHDEVIGRVSHIPHIAALAIKATAGGDERYAGGSYQGATRVADINASLWAGLLIDNKEYLKESMSQLKQNISILEDAINAGDADALETLLNDIKKTTE